MIISRTPYRVSFFGGGTDYPSWYRTHGGAVLATTINKYCYLTCRYLPPFFEHRTRIVYSKIENVRDVDEIVHPAVREVLRHVNIEHGVEIHHDGDLPARSGVGSSSAFTVGLLNALYALQGQLSTKEQLARESIQIEQESLKEMVGCQDQVLAAYGGFNHVGFAPNGHIDVRPMTLPAERIEELDSHLMLFYTRMRRTASVVARTYAGDLGRQEKTMRRLGEMVEEAIAILNGREDISRFGKLLHEGWQAKRSLSSRVSNARLEDIYDRARASGAIGGKVIGAGGGGFMLLFVPPCAQLRVRAELRELIVVPFRFERSGSQIIFYDREEDYTAVDEVRDAHAGSNFAAHPAPPSAVG